MSEWPLRLYDVSPDEFSDWLEAFTRGHATQLAEEADDETRVWHLSFERVSPPRPQNGGFLLATIQCQLTLPGKGIDDLPIRECFRFEALPLGQGLKLKIIFSPYADVLTGYLLMLFNEIQRDWPAVRDDITMFRKVLLTSETLEAPGVKEHAETEESGTALIMRRLDEMHLDLRGRLDDLKRGLAIIYQRVGAENRDMLDVVLEEVHQQRMNLGEIQSTLDAIRRVLRHIQRVGLPQDDEAIRKSLAEIYNAVTSDLGLYQQLEVALPVIPFLLQYKIGLDAGVDLAALWNEVAQRARKGTSTQG